MTPDLNHLLEGPEDAPVLVLSNSLGTALEMWDDATPPEHGGLIRDAIPDASHIANVEQPEKVTQLILDQLEAT